VSTLHITNGDCAAIPLRGFVDGPVIITADVLHEGPAPRADGDAWHDTRARFLASGGEVTVEQVRSDLARSDQTILDARDRGDELVLWFEHDLFDQLLLIRTLDLIGDAESTGDPERGALQQRVSLICIDRFPGVERFIGLGQLDATQLASLYPSRRPVTAEQFALASKAWTAFRSPDPRELFEIAVGLKADPALPFLGDALLRFLAEFPSLENGLSRTETLALTALRAGPLTGGALFAATQKQESRPFMGDAPFFDVLRGLAAGRVPLLTIEAAPDQLGLRLQVVAITDAGRDVLSGRLDRVTVNGIDLWRGGVHLAGSHRSPWRWDARRETLVS
jgi:hypothetical protein